MDAPAGTVTIDARPTPLTVDRTKTAVLVIDMQNDFGAEGGMFHRAGKDITLIQATVAPTARVLTAARTAGLPIIYLKMEFRPDLSDVGPADAPSWLRHARMQIGSTITAPDGRESRILIRDTWNTAILPELTPQAGDILVSKHRYSGFYQTELETILKTLGVTYLVVTGCTTSVCVESTIRDAMFRDYSCILLEDCTAEPVGYGLPRSNHDASLLVLQLLFGWVSNSDAFMEALQSQAAVGVGNAVGAAGA